MKKEIKDLDQKKIAICLMGPTASGKSDLAERLATILPAEIINVDSALVYRGMDIGTAKPSPSTLKKIPHHLIDIRSPQESYSAAEFVKDATKCLEEIHERHHLPLLVGGTMLYFKALLQGLSDLPSSDATLRASLEKTLHEKGLTALYTLLKTVDPEAANKIHANDPQRILRALEVYYLTGKKLSELQGQRASSASDFQFLCIGLQPSSRTLLHERIECRFYDMLNHGFLEEVSRLHAQKELHEKLPALRAVGYRQAWCYLENRLSYDEMIEKAITATRQLAKRQLTWLRTWPHLHWLDSNDPEAINQVIKLLEAEKIKYPTASPNTSK